MTSLPSQPLCTYWVNNMADGGLHSMNKMTVLGNNVGNLTDCTSLVIGGTSKRDIKAADIAGRI